jgi:hypothetical protein
VCEWVLVGVRVATEVRESSIERFLRKHVHCDRSDRCCEWVRMRGVFTSCHRKRILLNDTSAQHTALYRHPTTSPTPSFTFVDACRVSSQVGAVCKRCHDKIEWRKKYNKYKPISVPASW